MRVNCNKVPCSCLYGARRNDFDGANPFQGPLEGMGPRNGRTKKRLDFSGVVQSVFISYKT